MRKFNVIIDGVSYGVEVEETVEAITKENTLSAVAEQQIKAEEPKAAKPAAKSTSGEGTALKSPLPGMVMNFKVASGSAVKKGQIVLVLEAMKMENDIASPADGVITFVAVKGANVGTGDILAYIK